MEEKTLARKKESIINWLKDPYNLVLVGLLLCTLAVRIYYFVLTKNQPVWYDEAEYLVSAKSWLGWANWSFNVVRPVLFPLIIAGFFLIGLGEISLRVLMMLFSLGAIVFIYLIGKEFFNKKVGLLSAFLLAIFWSFTFYSFRLLVDVPVTFLWLATIYFFFNAYLKDKGLGHFALAGVFLGLSFLMKFSSLALVGMIGLYLLLTEKMNIIKNKKIWVFGLTALIIVLPYFMWQYFSFGSPTAFFSTATGGTPNPRSFFQSMVDQTKFSINILQPALVYLLIISLLYFIGQIALRYDNLGKKESVANKYLFLGLWIILSLIFFAKLNYGAYMDERYYFVFYPAFFIIISVFLSFIYDQLKKYSLIIGAVVILFILAFSAYQNIIMADQVIANKKDSFIQVKDLGSWLKKNTQEGDKILALQNHPELQYYSERKIITFTPFNSSAEVNAYVKANNITYEVFAAFWPQNILPWQYSYFFNNTKLEYVKHYTPFIDQDQKIPIQILFKSKN